MTKAFIIFTGHNDRAVVALCRAFSARNLAFYLVASSKSDPIFQTAWAAHVAWVRSDHFVDLSLFERVRMSLSEIKTLIYCPTTEFINAFALENRERLNLLGIRVMLPSVDVYQKLSNKSQSIDIVNYICGLKSPPGIAWDAAEAPCVFKPNSNLLAGVILYPFLCLSQDEVAEVQENLNSDQWFIQKYVQGQSHYLCGYLSRTGAYSCYWQTNLIQQPNGKSIVLARTGANPGLDESSFFNALLTMEYFGPVMMEVIEGFDGQLYFIEINPRFWGPLQLGVDGCSQMFDLYARDSGFEVAGRAPHQVKAGKMHWYAWFKGAEGQRCRFYPAADEFSDTELQNLLVDYDVYSRGDT